MNLHDRRDGESIIVLGHRGYHKSETENTLQAFDAAMREGCSGIELDVHITSDDRLVVHHDFSTKRVWGKDAVIEDSKLSEIHEISPDIPELSDVFDAFGPVYYDIEIKAGVRYRKRLITLLEEELGRRKELQERIMVSSFNPLAMHAFSKTMRYSYPLLIIYDPTPEVPWFLHHGEGRCFFRASGLKPRWDIAEKEKKSKRSYPVVPWTVDSREALDSMVALRAPVIITNESRMAVRALREESLM